MSRLLCSWISACNSALSHGDDDDDDALPPPPDPDASSLRHCDDDDDDARTPPPDPDASCGISAAGMTKPVLLWCTTGAWYAGGGIVVGFCGSVRAGGCDDGSGAAA
jgi:hypothetical protein